MPYYPTTSVDDALYVRHAINEIFNTYSDTVSVESKKKSLNKFGQNLTVGNSWETVAIFQSTTANETFVSTNIIDSIVSDASGDTGITFTIEGHTIDGSGNLTFVTQDATTNGSNGTTEVTLSTPLARANRMYVKNSGTFDSPQSAPAGNVYVYDNTDGISSGTPTTAAATKLMLTAGQTQSQKSATSISSQDYWLIDGISVAIGDAGGAAVYVTFRMEIRDVKNGGVWRPLGRNIIAIDAASQPNRIEIEPYLIVPKNHDFRIRAQTDSNTAPCFAEATGFLAIVV